MSTTLEFRLSGSGGQGLILAGIILGEAAVLAGKNAVQSQSYGPEARGGASKAEVIVSDGPIDYPKVSRPHVVLCLTDESYRKYGSEVDPEGVIIVDDSMTVPGVGDPVQAELYRLPIISTARDQIGRAMTANIVALGCICALTKVVDVQSLESAVLERVPAGTGEINLKAFRAGLSIASETGPAADGRAKTLAR